MEKIKNIIIPETAKRIFTIFKEKGYKIWLVGGSVRDLIMNPNAELKDLDFATPTKPEETHKILKESGLSCYTVGSNFGTIGTIINDTDIQVTTYRKKEQYKRGSRHPIVEFGENIDQDIARRDFKMNSIAVNEKGIIYDPYNGQDDIENKIISVAGNTDEILREDPLRMLRCGRFISKFDFVPAADLVEAATNQAHLIMTVSVERWKTEMDKLLLGKYPDRGLEFIIYTQLANYMMPELVNIIDFDQSSPYHHKDVLKHTLTVVKQTPAALDVRWAALMHDLGKVYTRTYVDKQVHFYHHEMVSALLSDSIMNRFKFPTDLKKRILNLIENHMHIVQYTPKWSDSAVRRFANRHSDIMNSLFALSKADITSSHPDRVQLSITNANHLEQRIQNIAEKESLEIKLPTGLGTAIINEFKIKPNRILGIIMRNVISAIEGGEIMANQPNEYYVEWVRKYWNQKDYEKKNEKI